MSENQNEETVEKMEMEGAGMRSTQKKTLKQRFSAKRLAFMGVFVALSYAVSLLEIPLPLFGAEFLKLDFGNVFIVLISFLLGPMEGILICLLKEGLRCLTFPLTTHEDFNFPTSSLTFVYSFFWLQPSWCM